MYSKSLNTSFSDGDITVTVPSSGRPTGRIEWINFEGLDKPRYRAVFINRQLQETSRKFWSVDAAEYWILAYYISEQERILTLAKERQRESA